MVIIEAAVDLREDLEDSEADPLVDFPVDHQADFLEEVFPAVEDHPAAEELAEEYKFKRIL